VVASANGETAGVALSVPTPLPGGGGARRRALSRKLCLEGGLLLLAAVAMAGGPRAASFEMPSTLLLWFGLVAATSLLPLPLPVLRRGELHSPAAAPVFAMGFLLGPSLAALAGFMSGAISGLVSRSVSWEGRFWFAARMAVAAAAASHAFLLAGGFAHPGLASSLYQLGAGDMVAIVLAGVAYLVVYLGAGILYVALGDGLDPWRVLQANWRGMMLGPVSFLLLGLVMAMTYLHVGPGSTVVVTPALLVTQGSVKLRLDLQRTRDSAIRALTSAIDARDPHTRGHSERVAAYAARVARAMGLRENLVEAVEVAAQLHDLGKVAVDPEVLARPHRLAPDERVLIYTHAEAGARVMSELSSLAEHAEIVRHHHERPDGAGYPEGLRGEEVPMGSRILKVLDAFDAMTSDRPYRRALPREEALQELSRGAGTEFEAKVVEVVIELARRGELAPPN
jgi:putative nucleotidyltransferase with HDIG domain